MRRRPGLGNKGFLYKVFIQIQGIRHDLWRVVDPDGVVLDIRFQPRRDARAAKRFVMRLPKELQYAFRVIVTEPAADSAEAAPNC